MPILSIYCGNSDISFLYVESSKEYRFYKYPYVYSKDLYGHFVSEAGFYQNLLEMISKDLNFSLTNTKVLLTGFPSLPEINFHVDLGISLDKLINVVQEYYSVYINNFTVLSPSGFFSAYPLNAITTKQKATIDNKMSSVNYYSNMSVFPQISLTYDSDRFENDNFIRFLSLNSANDISSDRPIMFSGDRFSNNSKYEPLTYLLAIDMIKDLGIYELKLDLDNILPVLSLLAAFDPAYISLFQEQKFCHLGTLINAQGYVECLVEKEFGPSHFIEVKNNELFFLPLEDNTRINLKIKGGGLGTKERFVPGGKLGLIIDTRPKRLPVFNQKYLEKNYKIWEANIKSVLNTMV